MEKDEKLLLTEKEAAVLLSISTHFLRRDRISLSGVGIPFVRIGGAIRYHRSALETWIVQNAVVSLVTVERPPLENVSEKRRRGRPTKAEKIRNCRQAEMD